MIALSEIVLPLPGGWRTLSTAGQPTPNTSAYAEEDQSPLPRHREVLVDLLGLEERPVVMLQLVLEVFVEDNILPVRLSDRQYPLSRTLYCWRGRSGRTF